MKKSNHDYLKRVRIIQPIIFVLLSFLLTMFIFNKGVSNSKKYNYNVSSYEQTSYDYIITDLIDEQLPEIKNYEGISRVFSYYEYKGTVSKKNKEENTTILFSEDNHNLDLSAFNTERMIKGNYNLDNNGLFVDQRVARNLNLKINDKINVKFGNVSIEFSVRAIFMDNLYYDGNSGSIYFNLTEQIKLDIISKREIQLRGVLIDSYDPDATLIALKDFKPLANLLPREDFSTEREYLFYKEQFLNTDYSSRVFNKNAVYDRVVNDNKNQNTLYNSKIMLIVGAVIYVVLIMAISLRNLYLKDSLEKHVLIYHVEVEKNALIISLNRLNILTVVLSLIINLIIITLFNNKNTLYGNYLTNTQITIYWTAILGYVLLTLLDKWFIYSNYDRKRKQNAKN